MSLEGLPFKHDGKTYKISCDINGMFMTLVDGEPQTADTLKKLQEKIIRVTRKASVRIALPALLVRTARRHWSTTRGEDNIAVDKVTVTGIHQRNGYILVQLPDGKRDHIDNYHDDLFKPEMNVEKYLLLKKAKKHAEEALEKFETTWKMGKGDIEQRVRAAEKQAGIEESEE